MSFHWTLANPEPDACQRLSKIAGISPLLASCLVNRGFTEPDVASRFLEPRLKNLADPYLLPNMAEAVERLLTARAQGELLVIFGDYDVDGVTATALLLEALNALGWKVAHYLPHRFEEGYGFSSDAVKTCLDQFPARLLLAVDCGSTAHEIISALGKNGIDVIVVDHHQVSNPPPPAFALVNPQLADSFHELCSVGLAFKLIHAVVKRMRELGESAAADFDIRNYLDLAALGTIADLVPLRGENRIFVMAGLERLNGTQRPGLLALKAVAKCHEPLGGYEVAFQLAPRLNAAGRLQNADEALRLLITRDAAEAAQIARSLDERNRERQDIERAICDEVTASLRGKFDRENDYVIVEGHASWHIGVVGIVAARVSREFYRPVIICGGDGAYWRGSGRSIEGFDLASALRDCHELLVRHGGHAMAAGLTLSEENVVLFRQRMNELARQTLKPEQLQRSLLLDASVNLSELTLERVEELRRLDPTGQGNPEVRLAIRGVRHHLAPMRMGKDNQHVKFRVTDGRQMIEAVWWNAGQASWPEGTFELAATASINDYRGRRTVQLKILDWRPSS